MSNVPDPQLARWYESIADQIAQRYLSANKQHPLLLAISGPQGSGKSTLAAHLPQLLQTRHGLKADGFSIDDVYLTRSERQNLARKVHPLLATRGAPGTHDLALADITITGLMTGKGHIPAFDKALDDRAPENTWRKILTVNDIIIVEGWCMCCPPEDDQTLEIPINELEKTEDQNALWRNFVNEKLRHEYAEFFKRFHMLIWLQAPSFDQVYAWRGLQEQKLREKSPTAPNIMTHDQLVRFISHYERLTRHMLRVMPALADITILLDEKHSIKGLLPARASVQGFNRSH